MAFVDPAQVANDPAGLDAGRLISGGDVGLPPLANNKPNAMKALNTKWTPTLIKQAQSTYGKDTVASLLKWELERAQRGVPPTTALATGKLLQSAKTRQAATQIQKPDPTDVLGNIAGDVGNIAEGIITAPTAVAHDITHLGETMDAISSGDVNKILTAPGIRMIPGTYTAHNILSGDLNEIASHPLATALDVLPYAHMLGVGEAIGKIPLGEKTLKERSSTAVKAFNRTLPGQFVQQTWGADSRFLAKTLAGQVSDIHSSAIPAMKSVFKDTLSGMRQESTRAEQAINKHITPERQVVIKQALEDPASLGVKTTDEALSAVNASDAELGAVKQFRNVRDSYEQYGLDTGSLFDRVVSGNHEILDARDAAKLDKGHALASRTRVLTDLREAIINPTTPDFGALHEQVSQFVKDEARPVKDRRAVASGYIHALDKAGYQTGSLLTDISKVRGSNIEQFVRAADELRQEPGTVRTRRRTGDPALEAADRWKETHRQFTPKRLAQVEEALQGREARMLPARWQPAFQRFKVDKARNYIEQTFAPDDPQVKPLLERVNQNVYKDLPEELQKQFTDEAIAEVNNLREQGYNPEFVHHVSRGQEAALASPSITTIVPKASQYGSRLNDWTPGSNSLSVSINHQGMELARQVGARAALDELRDPLTTSVRDATAELSPAAERAARRSGRSYGEELERLMKKEYVLWKETEHGFMAGDAKQFRFSDTRFKMDDLLVKRHIANSLKMIASPPTYSRIFDPVTKVFRTAVLPFSPRFHVNNVAGGLITSMLEDPRVLAQIPRAMEFSRDINGLVKAMSRGDEYTLKPTSVDLLERMHPDMRRQIGSLKYSVAPEGQFQMRAGGKAGELAQAAGVDRMMKKGMSAAKAAEEWSYDMNETVDMMYRTAAYLSGEDSALTKGLSTEEAASRGMALADKIQPRWLEMTPMERSVMRVVFPFYGFMSHLFRFAMRFPIDHPWRTAVMANMARAEVNDLGTGLPQMLANAFFLGSPDKAGNVTAITPGAMNPFRDLGDNLTVAGFMGQTNPIFKAALTQLGYDPSQRGPNLYPEVEYDPKTGNLRARQQSGTSMLGQLVTGFVPQANIAAALTGTSGDFKNLMETNPGAANRMLSSSTGIPLLWRKYNVNQEIFDAEAVRQDQMKKVLSTAMKTGDYSQAKRYPSLRGQIATLQKLYAQGKLAPYIPGPPSLAKHNAQQSAQGGSQANTQAELGA